MAAPWALGHLRRAGGADGVGGARRKNYVIRGLIAVLIAVIILTRLDLNGILYLQNTEQVRAATGGGAVGAGRAGGKQATDISPPAPAADIVVQVQADVADERGDRRAVGAGRRLGLVGL